VASAEILTISEREPAEFVHNQVEKDVQFVVQFRPSTIYKISASVLHAT